MKTSVRNTLLSSLLFAAVGLAQAETPAPSGDATPPVKAKTAQQQKMSDCSKQSAGKKGQEYKDAVSTCLKGSAAADAAKPTQQQKMATCSKAAKGKKGQEYKDAVSACLKS